MEYICYYFAFWGWLTRFSFKNFLQRSRLGGEGGGAQNWYTSPPSDFLTPSLNVRFSAKNQNSGEFVKSVFPARKIIIVFFSPDILLVGGGRKFTAYIYFRIFLYVFFIAQVCTFLMSNFAPFYTIIFANLEPKICPMSHQSLR